MGAPKLQVGKVEILELTDAAGPFRMPLSQVFPGITAEQWAPYRQRFPATFVGEDGWHVHFGGFLVRSGGRTLLVDTGLVTWFVAFWGERHLLAELAATGVALEDIDTVFLTHAHPDHVGHNLTSAGTPTFPRARYLLHQADWDALPELQSRTPAPFVEEALTPLRPLGVLELLSGETALTAEVVALPAPGHTPGHMALLITSSGEKALIVGDAVGHPAQVTEPTWPLAMDFDRETAITTRKTLLDRIEAEEMTLIQCHFPSPGYGRIVRLEGRRYWQAL